MVRPLSKPLKHTTLAVESIAGVQENWYDAGFPVTTWTKVAPENIKEPAHTKCIGERRSERRDGQKRGKPTN